MGFKNKKSSQFTPLDLNENTVQTIFNNCLATEKSTTIISSSLFKKEKGYEKPDTPITFSQESIKNNLQNIKYLLGQIESIHDGSLIMYSSTGAKKYTGKNWTVNSASLMKLLHLGLASGLMSSFNAKGNFAELKYIKPTLSPRDPNFIDWYDSYLAETKKSEGPTIDEK